MSPSDLFIGVLLAFLFVYWTETKKRFTKLEGELEELKRQLAALRGSNHENELAVRAKVEAFYGEEPVAEVAHQGAELRKTFTPPLLSSSHALVENQREPTALLSNKVREPSSLRESVLHLLTNSVTLARVGILVLIIGLAFLVQYAASQGYLSLELRLAASALSGLTLSGLGWRLRLQRPVYSLTLQGGGIGIMYLTVLASFQLYGMLPSTLAFILLLLFTALSAFLAMLQDARSLATLSVLGGFLAPVLVSTGQGSHVALFGYYLVLNLGILTIAWFKEWRSLTLLGFVFTFIVGATWGGLEYRPALFASTEPFLILFFLLYLVATVLHAYQQPSKLNDRKDNTLIFGLPIITLVLQSALVQPFSYGLAWSALGLALIYFLSAWSLSKLRPGMRRIAEQFLAIGLVFTTLTVPLAANAFGTGASWALLSVGLVFFGIRRRRPWLRTGGMLLLAVAALALFVGVEELSTGTPFALSSAILGLSSLSVAYLLFMFPQRLRPWERMLGHGFLGFGLLWWGLAGFFETAALLPQRFQPSTYLAFLTLTAVVCVFLSPRLRWPILQLPALALLPLMAGILLGTSNEHPFAFAGWLVWPLAFVAYYWILRRSVRTVHSSLLGLAHAGSFWLLTIVAVLELGWLAGTLVPGSNTWSLVAYIAAPLLLMLLVTSPHVRVPDWLKAYRATYLTLGLTPVAAAVLLWATSTNFLSNGNVAPLPYLPLLNPLDLAQALSLIALILWNQQLAREVRLDQRISQIVVWLIIALGILWPSAMMARAFHHWLGMPFSFAGLLATVNLQTVLTIFWTVYALFAMLLAARKQLRSPWLLGASLLGLVMVKLFVVDLAQVGTIARIISFIGVGVLLLLLAYLAPVPPKAKARTGAIGLP